MSVSLRRELVLFKLLLFSRFTKPFLAFYLILVISYYFLIIGASHGAEVPLSSTVGLLTVPVVVSSLLSRVFFTKSDVDFLFPLPLDRKEILVGLYLVSIVANGLFSLYFGAFAVDALGPAGFAVLIALVLLTSSMSIALAAMKLRKRLLIATIIGVWFLSPLFGFPFSPYSMFIGYNFAYALLALLTALFVFLSVKNLNELELLSVQGQTQSSKVKEISFSSGTPFVAVLKRSLSFLELAARVNYMGVSTFKTFRINVKYLLIASTLISVVYYLIVVHLGINGALNDHFFGLTFLLTFLLIYVTLIFAQSSFMFEPLWLSFGILGPLRYARYYMLSRAISLEIALAPFSVVNALLGDYTVAFLVSGMPFIYVYMASVIASLNPIQIKDENAPVVRFSATQFLIPLLLAPPLLLDYFSLFAMLADPSAQLYIGVVSFLIQMGLGLPFLFWKKFWEKAQEKMLSNNFV
ncbi:MAG: hypothetical protein TQ35_0010390 [Candidatus Aramenus sulfurataquae]|jgi:hypothetical protein|uniref:Uncharacterized protein n=2 Tax=Candidatus Aramenus sulfurataquae TaxID=1326980 RepID=A0AAE3K2F1_9CREN|nr:hypothetical protein [Candidatus Aramenus sulfurataquae]